MTRRRVGGARVLGDLMSATLGSARLAKGVQKARAILAWPQAVGPEIARITRPRSQQGGTLFIEVRDSATAHHLTMQRHHFLKALNELLPDAPVRELRFSVGSVRTPVAAPPPPVLPAPDRARARQLVKDVPGELHPAALRAAEAVTRARKWRESQGWRPCPVCGEASREQPCRDCALTLEDPNVKRAARALQREPERLTALPGTLGDSGAQAARYLAVNSLHDQLHALALECVRSGLNAPEERSYLTLLAQLSQVFLSLRLNKPRAALQRADRVALPEQVRSVLDAHG